MNPKSQNNVEVAARSLAAQARGIGQTLLAFRVRYAMEMEAPGTGITAEVLADQVADRVSPLIEAHNRLAVALNAAAPNAAPVLPWEPWTRPSEAGEGPGLISGRSGGGGAKAGARALAGGMTGEAVQRSPDGVHAR